MIRPLRQRHRVMIFALSVALPAGFALGIATRKEVPTSRSTGFKEVRNSTELWSRDDLWEKKAIRTRLLRSGSGAGQLSVELRLIDRIVRPDVLVYWVPGESKIQKSLPDDAFLLGSFEQSIPVPLALPDIATTQTGALVLYSLADQELVAVSKSFVAK
jgi:hypothetical protein